MYIEDLLVWLLACYGITFVLCSAKLTAAPRRWLCRWGFFRELLGCYFCSGFWVGFATAIWLMEEPVSALSHGLGALLHGFAGATFSYALDALLRRLERSEAGVPYDFIESAALD